MGVYDRDYYRRSLPRGGFAHFSAWSVTTWLILLNVAIFIANGVLRRVAAPPQLSGQSDWEIMRQWMLYLMGPMTRWGYFSSDLALFRGEVWRFITFQFLHVSLLHLGLNMVGLFFFGQIVEAHFGPRRYLAFYLLCGLGGAGCYLLLGLCHVLPDGPHTPLIGASAGVFGLLVAAAVIAPDLELFCWFVPVTVKMLAIGGLLLAVYQICSLGEDAGGEAAHLGGGLLALAIMKNQHWLNPFAEGQSFAYAGAGRRRRRSRTFQKDWSKDLNR